MAKEQKQVPYIISSLQDREEEKEREFDPGSDEPGTPLPLTVTSRVLYMLGDLTAGPAYKFTQWLELVRKRTINKYRPSGFPTRPDAMHMSARESNPDLKNISTLEQTTEISLWEKLGKAAVLDVEPSSFSWDMLSSLHHTEHSGSTEQSDDDTNRALEVTVNSGGVVFFALFSRSNNGDLDAKEAAAVIKISSSRMATQSERLGYEFAKWLGVRVPQARVIHNFSLEWLQIKEAAEKARDAAVSEGDEVGEMTCSELLEALELSRCLFLMNREVAEKIAVALADKRASANMDALVEERCRPIVIGALQKERRTTSVAGRLDAHNAGYESQRSDISDVTESPLSSKMKAKDQSAIETDNNDFLIVAIDSGVPRRPPAGKRANDQENYPKLVELLLNSSAYSSNLLYEITGGKLGSISEGTFKDSISSYSLYIRSWIACYVHFCVS
ncbi:hypothetical protein Nepgr_002945 [Nepenthes gracilis]|uniref:Actin-fragmin kinase catalytic domain-containing protein n=1 Tax=Nepenthes gracilis TaxID=150966 RepID=A0AAD3P766_NEPGR|nr:hypothetical protein Nepgr_002945 [Nepenthes gracilis]